jgi:IS5 family transposase
VRRYTVTNAARHDSQEFGAVLDDANTCRDVWADSAYRSTETEQKQAERFRSRVHRHAKRNHGLSEREEKGNESRSKVRARVEHVFGHQVIVRGASWCAPLASSARERKSACKT